MLTKTKYKIPSQTCGNAGSVRMLIGFLTSLKLIYDDLLAFDCHVIKATRLYYFC